jgi:ribosomal protein S18 acetylase RimI-like enzyme
MVENMGVTPEQAAAEAERQTLAMLPAGAETPGQHLTRAVEDGAEVGFRRLTTTGLGDSGLAWISVIEVRPEHRSKAIGSQMSRAARSVPYVGLNVPGTEPPALAFAASAGLGMELIS